MCCQISVHTPHGLLADELCVQGQSFASAVTLWCFVIRTGSGRTDRKRRRITTWSRAELCLREFFFFFLHLLTCILILCIECVCIASLEKKAQENGNQLPLGEKKTFCFVHFFRLLSFLGFLFVALNLMTPLYIFFTHSSAVVCLPSWVFFCFWFFLFFNHWPLWRFGATPSGLLCGFRVCCFCCGDTDCIPGGGFWAGQTDYQCLCTSFWRLASITAR